VRAVDLVRRAEIHRDAVLHHAVLLEDLVEHVERPTALDHKILRDDLKPRARRFLREDVLVVRHAQPQPDPVVGEPVETIGRHERKKARPTRVGRAVAPEKSALLRFGFLVALGGRLAAAFAFAGILALAAVVAGAAAAGALAVVFAFVRGRFLGGAGFLGGGKRVRGERTGIETGDGGGRDEEAGCFVPKRNE
jgi:hypothetical protein